MTRIDARTRLVAVLGYPLGHSLSPLIHNAAFQAQGLNFCYVACPVRPDDLPAAVAGLRALQFAGANVTIPHKQAILNLVDERSDEAEAVGAVNTVVSMESDDGIRLRGDNTDVRGFLSPLGGLLPSLQGQDVVLFGAGGAARAAVYALLTRGRPQRLTLVAREEAKAAALAESLQSAGPDTELEARSFGEAGHAVRRSILVVNATPIGMTPGPDESPWPRATDFGPGQTVYDLVYNPPRTRLLREAEARGARVIDGIDMFIGQAAEAYRQWTSREMPHRVAREELERHLNRRPT